MSLNAREVIKNYLLDENVSDDERFLRFQIAWDVSEAFPLIRQDMLLNKVFQPLRRKIEEYVSPEFEVSHLNWGAIYITKHDWKERPDDRGIIALAVESWLKGNAEIGVVKNRPFTLDYEDDLKKVLCDKLGGSSTQWWLCYHKRDFPLMDYFKQIFHDPFTIVEDYFGRLMKIYEVVNEEHIQNMLDDYVEKRKADLKRGV